MHMDDFDRRILDIVQRDAGASAAEKSASVGLSQVALRRLEQAGYVERRVALLDRHRLGWTCWSTPPSSSPPTDGAPCQRSRRPWNGFDEVQDATSNLVDTSH